MCPACLATAAMAVAGVTSAGGFGAFLAAKLLRTGAEPEDFQLRMQPDEGGDHGPAARRVTG